MYKIKYDDGYAVIGDYVSPLSPLEMLEIELPDEIQLNRFARSTILRYIDNGPFFPEGYDDNRCLPGISIQRKNRRTGDLIYDIYVWCDQCNRWHHHGLTEENYFGPVPMHKGAHCTYNDNVVWQLAESNMKRLIEIEYQGVVSEDIRKELVKKRLPNYIDNGYFIMPVVFISTVDSVL